MSDVERLALLSVTEARFFTLQLADDRHPETCVVCGQVTALCACTLDELNAWLAANRIVQIPLDGLSNGSHVTYPGLPDLEQLRDRLAASSGVPPSYLWGPSPMDNHEIRFFARRLEQLRTSLRRSRRKISDPPGVGAMRLGRWRIRAYDVWYPVHRYHSGNKRASALAHKWTRHEAKRWCRRLAPLVGVAHDCILEQNYARALELLGEMLPRDVAVRWIARGVATSIDLDVSAKTTAVLPGAIHRRMSLYTDEI